MTNPSIENDIPSAGQKARDASVVTPPDTGGQAPRLTDSSGTAGAADSEAPRQFSSEEALNLLVAAVTALEEGGKQPVAAGVSARMKTIRRDFSLQRTEFTRFRQLLDLAVRRGLIEVRQGEDDLAVSLCSRAEPVRVRGEMLRTDLWRALVDWSGGPRYVYRPSAKTTSVLTGELAANDVLVPSLSDEERSDWISQFVQSQSPDEKAQLEAAVSVGGFRELVRASEPLKRRWSRYLRRRVLDRATEWAAANGIPESDIFVSSPKPSRPIVTAGAPKGDDALRQRVLETLSTMPLHELLRLPIPLEYTLR